MIAYLNGILIKIYNKIISLRLINRNNKTCRRLRSMLFHNICYEAKARFGRKNPGRIFYIIRNPQDSMGLFAAINYVVYHLGKADKLQYEPVVDWQYYPNKYYSEDNKVGKVNVWEDFFQQTSRVSLCDAYKSKNVIMSSGIWDADAMADIYDDSKLLKNHDLYVKYIHLKEDLELRIKEESERVGFDKYRILAIKIRGTDFITTHPSDHAKTRSIEETIRVIEGKCHEWGGFDRLYLSTEDQQILDRMVLHFGNKLYYTRAHSFECRDVNDKWLGDFIDATKVQKIDLMKEYLVSTYMLSKADYLIAPEVGGTVGALRIHGKYKSIYIL